MMCIVFFDWHTNCRGPNMVESIEHTVCNLFGLKASRKHKSTQGEIKDV